MRVTMRPKQPRCRCVGVPYIFLLTDGAVENERAICRHVEVYHSRKLAAGALHARISTFAIGPFCNHFFLKQLAASGGVRVGSPVPLVQAQLGVDVRLRLSPCVAPSMAIQAQQARVLRTHAVLRD